MSGLQEKTGGAVNVTASQLDNLAAEAAPIAAAAFAAAGWEWGGAPWGGREAHTPDAAEIAVRLRGMMADLEPGHSRSSGRLTVWRGLEEDSAVEQFDVSLDLGTVHGL